MLCVPVEKSSSSLIIILCTAAQTKKYSGKISNSLFSLFQIENDEFKLEKKTKCELQLQLVNWGDENLIILFKLSSLFFLTSIKLCCFVSSVLTTVQLQAKYQSIESFHVFQIN